MKEILNELENPSQEYRPLPFWSWNDKLEPEMLKWQVREMARAGLGGYFMHARGGLKTQYLGEDWMNCIKTCIEEGNEAGVSSWCYDEEGWPSGFAGGIVTAMGDKYHVRWLEYEECTWNENAIDSSGVLGYYRQAGNSFVKESGESLQTGDKIIIIRHRSNPYYIDILNENVIKVFIESTHEEYYNRFGEHFGKGMPGFFTDEPQFSRGKIPWSYIIPERFMQKYGYDLLEKLPLIFISGEGHESVRYDFWSLVNELYVSSFGKQIYDWCEERNCKLTGHVMAEDSICSQMGATAGVMPFYEYMHIPGIDWLGRNISSPFIPKQVGSVARQLGKKQVLSETFALCGWDVSWEELKWIAEWQYVNGVNLMCQHLEGYTLKGLRKRDYPPSMFYQQSWWEEYKGFNDYFSRLGVLLTSGKQAVDVLLLHPIKSGWIAYDGSENDSMHKLDREFVQISELLSGLHIDYHYGDETILKRHGRVENGKLVVGECKYGKVIIPSMLTIDEITTQLLLKFMDKGGQVVSVGDFPQLCEGRPSESLSILQHRVTCCSAVDKARNEIKSLIKPNISIAENNQEVESIHVMQRDIGNTQAFFLVNYDQKKAYSTAVSIADNGSIKLYNAMKNEMQDILYTGNADVTQLKLEFLPMQSHILVFGKGETECRNAVVQEYLEVKPAKAWTLESMDLNSLTLDYCSYRIDDGEWIGPVAVIKLMDLLLHQKRSCDISLKFSFDFNAGPEAVNELYLAIEEASEFEITINGSKVEYFEIGWWKDSSFKKVDIKSYVVNGTNEVILSREFYQQQKVYDVLFGEGVLETEKNKLTFDTELESIYVVGDFGVISKSAYSQGERKAVFTEGPFVIVDKPVKANTGDLTEQGFCFFAGAVKISQQLQLEKTDGKRIGLDLGKPCATLSKVYINDKLVDILPWSPYKCDITDFVKPGANKLTVELFAGNRNLLGPHHHVDGELYGVGPASFTEKEGWEGTPGRYIWSDKYCFVKFGL